MAPLMPADRMSAGQDSRDHALRLLNRADALLDKPGGGASGTMSLEDALEDAQVSVLAALRDLGGQASETARHLTDTLAELFDARDLVRRTALHRRLESGGQVRRALTELRAAPTAAAVMDRAVKVLCTHCGFDRAFLFRVENAEMVVDSVYFTEDRRWAQEFHDLALIERPQLTNTLLETEMIRRRAPVIIQNPATDPRTFKPLVLPVKTTSYVAAPIMPDDKVIGFLHADCYFQNREVDEIDRDTLWAFAEGFGFAVDRAILVERLNAQRGEVRRLVATTNGVLNDLCDAELRMTRDTAASVALAGVAASSLLPGIAGTQHQEPIAGLTRREIEVIGLIAEGRPNNGIARSLVISESTVKSHIKSLMRKLRAQNRSEAVAKYNKLVANRQG